MKIKVQIYINAMGSCEVEPIAKKHKGMNLYVQMTQHIEDFFRDFKISKANKNWLNRGWPVVVKVDYDLYYHWAMNFGPEEFINKELFK